MPDPRPAHPARRCKCTDTWPCMHSVHYVSKLASSQEVLVDTRAESRSGNQPVTVVAGRGAINGAATSHAGPAQSGSPVRSRHSVASVPQVHVIT